MRVGDDPRRRAILILLLLGLQVGMFIQYGIHTEKCPNYECIAEDYASYVGEQFRLGGTVVATEPLVIENRYAPGNTLRLTLRGIDRSLSRGARVVVYGRLQPGHTVTVQDYIVHEVANQRYMYAVSLGALLLVVLAGLRYWRFDPATFVFERRGEN